MALNNNDLFVVQSQADSQLYKLRLDDLVANIQGGSGIQFKGSVDLNNSPAAQTPVVTLPAVNGDMYVVESDAAIIEAGWTMVNGETSAQESDRIIWDADSVGWILVGTGSGSGGTITDITTTFPLMTDGDPVTPVHSIHAARTQTLADADGDALTGGRAEGYVPGIAEAADVAADSVSNPTHVVPAALLAATNKTVSDLILSPGGLQTIAEGVEAAGETGALIVVNNAGAVTLQVTKDFFAPYNFSALDDITA